MNATVEALRKASLLGPLDEHCARTVCRIAGEPHPDVLLAAAVAARQVGLGHVCVDLRMLAASGRLVADDGVTVHDVAWPDPAGWIDRLQRSSAVGEPSDAERRPLVLDRAGRLYLRRYFEHEQRLAASIVRRATAHATSPADHELETALDRLFGPTSAASPDRQRDAARTAVTRRLCIISGGPGTGKTSTVVKILALLVEQQLRARRRPPRVLLVAPTGKAAMRLSEAIRRAKSGLDCGEDVRAAIPEEASTVHRALGSIDGKGTRFRHDADHPLRADVVLVDEASMVDLALMARLVDAVPPDARLVLLGDKDQLASVEAGAVLGELCAVPDGSAATAAHPLGSAIVELERSWRYREGSGIEALARAINAADATRVLEILDDPAFDDVERSAPGDGVALSERLRGDALRGALAYLDRPEPAARLQALEEFRILCAHRAGPHGVASANREVEELLADRRRIDRQHGATYAGRPVIITRNDYQVQLFNGDVGTIVAQGDKRLAFFVAPDGTERLLSPARLPPHETVFAMTIHKSQGSEFDHVAVLLGDRSSPLLTRELLYTAVTRARRKVTLYATEAVLREAIQRRTERGSGLRDALKGAS